MNPAPPPVAVKARLSAWHAVVGFGVVSLFADMVYEGARSLYGPALVAVGASATVVGLVTGAGEAMALVLRLVAGPWADRRGAHWSFTIVGYALTALCVPMLALAPRLGAAGLAFVALVILAERTGKAVRSPSKSALLAHAARAVGGGRGFGVHKALDQIGAFAGPLLATAVIALAGGSIWPGLGWLAAPGVAAMVVLLWLRSRIPDPTVYDATPARPAAPTGRTTTRGTWWREVVGSDLPPVFFRYALAAALTTGALVGFALVSVHLVRDVGLRPGLVPVVYAGAMLVEAVAALVTGRLYDARGSRVLLVVPVLVAVVPVLAFGGSLPLALAGVVAWAAATGVQDSTIKALVADLVPSTRLATAYGLFAAVQGALAVVGGATAGYLLDHSVTGLCIAVAVTQVVALVLLWATTRRTTTAG